jgi:histidine triad (HIT) family protein
LILPKKHVASLNALTAEDRKSLFPGMYQLADEWAQQQGFRERGYRVVINNQAEGGQTVFHLHMHVLAGAPMKGHFGA